MKCRQYTMKAQQINKRSSIRLWLCIFLAGFLVYATLGRTADKPTSEKQIGQKSTDSKEDTLRLITNINQRTINSVTKSKNLQSKQSTQLESSAMIALQLLREYGFTASSLIWMGDFLLIYKTGQFTTKCAQQGLIKLKGEDLDATAVISDPAGAIRLFTKTFTPAERAALQYEIISDKTPKADEKRKKLLDQSGYDTNNIFHLTSKPDDPQTPVSKESGSAKWDQKAMAEYAGVYGFVLQMTLDKPSQYFLAQVAHKLPVITLKSSKDFSSIPLHTDLKIMFAVPTKDGVLVRCLGKAAYNTIPLTDKMTEMGGYPGTRLDLSNIQVPLSFLGKKWLPKAGATCVIQIAKERIEVFGCNVTWDDKKMEKANREAEKKALRQIAEEKKKAKKSTTMEERPFVSAADGIKREGRFIASDNGTVLDTRTNLMWAAKDNGSDINWNNAKNYCENYRGGGYTDWRMPTQDELSGLYDDSKSYRSTQRNYSVHLTELILMSACCPWASEKRDFSAGTFDFGFGHRGWHLPSDGRDDYRALPVRGQAVEEQKKAEEVSKVAIAKRPTQKADKGLSTIASNLSIAQGRWELMHGGESWVVIDLNLSRGSWKGEVVEYLGKTTWEKFKIDSVREDGSLLVISNSNGTTIRLKPSPDGRRVSGTVNGKFYTRDFEVAGTKR